MIYSRAGAGKIQDEPEYLVVPERKKCLKKKKKGTLKGHKAPPEGALTGQS